MNRNQLKLLACASMLADHIGYFLFPQLHFLRYIGRLAMPLFAFFIGEGCVHTSNRKKYFLTMFLPGVGCQAVYLADDLITVGHLSPSSACWYFNILFTFSLSSLAGFLLNDAVKSKGNKKRRAAYTAAFLLYLAALFALTEYFAYLGTKGCSFYLDYGFCGILLPLAGIPFRDKRKKLAAFSAMLLIYCLVFFPGTPYVWFALADIPLLAAYNGKPGSRKFKYFFYVFYPAHLAAIYLVSILI